MRRASAVVSTLSYVTSGRSTTRRAAASMAVRFSIVWLATWPRFSPVTSASALQLVGDGVGDAHHHAPVEDDGQLAGAGVAQPLLHVGEGHDRHRAQRLPARQLLAQREHLVARLLADVRRRVEVDARRGPGRAWPPASPATGESMPPDSSSSAAARGAHRQPARRGARRRRRRNATSVPTSMPMRNAGVWTSTASPVAGLHARADVDARCPSTSWGSACRRGALRP